MDKNPKTIRITEQRITKVHFEAIGRVVVAFSFLESHLVNAFGFLLGLDEGNTLRVARRFNFPNIASTVEELVKREFPDDTSTISDLMSDARRLDSERNAISHDLWIRIELLASGEKYSPAVGRMRRRGPFLERITFVPINELTELRDQIFDLEKRCKKFFKDREIAWELPTGWQAP